MMQVMSAPMRVLRKLGMDRRAWALRRYHVPVKPDALVLEVGSGGNPYPRSNVLLDAHEHTRERHWVPLVADRPTVMGFVENLPFRDGAFDFVIASHVLEHSAHPERFLAELQRVAKAGYIETPDAYMERTNPYRDHRLEVTERDGALVIRKKRAWVNDPELTELYEHAAKWPIALETIPRHPFDFHVRYYWRGTIPFSVVNPEVDATWAASAQHGSVSSGELGLRARARAALRLLLAQRKRNASIDLIGLLKCIHCNSESLKKLDSENIQCAGCKNTYALKGTIPVMAD